LEGLERLDYPKDRIHLVWHDTSHIEAFGKKLEEWLKRHNDQYASMAYTSCDKPHYHFEEKQYEALDAITEGYNHCREMFRGDYFFTLEDDIVAQENALKRLLFLNEEDKDVKASAGLVFYRPSSYGRSNQPVAWNFEQVEVFPDEGKETATECRLAVLPSHKNIGYVGSAHLGCTLIDGDFVRRNPFCTQVDGTAGGCDVVVGYKIYKEGYKYALDWGLKCKHYDIDGNFV
jgi:hypothetical protein